MQLVKNQHFHNLNCVAMTQVLIPARKITGLDLGYILDQINFSFFSIVLVFNSCLSIVGGPEEEAIYAAVYAMRKIAYMRYAFFVC